MADLFDEAEGGKMLASTKCLIFFLLMSAIHQVCAAIQLRDPTLPLARKDYIDLDKSARVELKIQGLFISKAKRVALIDDKFYIIGDNTKAGEIVAIFKDRIVVKQGEKMRVIFMTALKVRQ